MARNGSGVYSLPTGYLAVDGETIQPSQHNTPLQDIAADLNAARPIAAGGTGATSASAARAALGLAIGTDIQAYDAGLTSIAGLTTAADRMIYATGPDAYAVTTLSSWARTLLDDGEPATARNTLALGTAAVRDEGTGDDDLPDNARVSALIAAAADALAPMVFGPFDIVQSLTPIVVTHNLNTEFPSVEAFIKCIEADQGYAVGDVIPVPILNNVIDTSGGTGNRINAPYIENANQFSLSLGNGVVNAFVIRNKAANSISAALNARWELYIKVRR